jgi:acyl-CoA synthetase (NDP forming)
MRLIGPNSMGGISFETKISATFTSVNMHEGRGWPPLGGVSIASQSGFVGSHLLGMFRDRGLGLAKWLATGNQTDIDLADCIENFANDSITRTIAVYLEGAGRPDSLRWAFDIARANGKPIVALKAGRSDVGARAVASHTASLIGSNDAFEAVFRRHGVYEARTLDELVDVVAALDTGKRPRDNTVGVATVSGGFGILIADAAAHHGFELPELDRERQRTLREIYPLATTRNPVDVGSFAPFNAAIERLLDDVYGSVVLAIGHFGLMADRMDALHGALAAFRVDHPDTFISLVACLNEHWRRQFQQLGLFVCEDPARAVHAIAALRWLDERARLADDPIPAVAAIDPATLSARHDERTARDIVRAIGIPVVADTLVNTASEAIDAARAIGSAVVMKVLSADIAHKSDIGCVMLAIEGDDATAVAFNAIMENARKGCPAAHIDGVIVSPMIEGGVETIVGVTRDPVFGPVILFGLGGIFVEVFHDTVANIAPFGPGDAMMMIRSIKGFPLLAGARGQPAADLDALADALSRISVFAHDNAEAIESLEINPLLATTSGVLALDALIVARKTF